MHGSRIALQILEAGVKLWERGSEHVNARAVGKEVGLSHAGVLYHFKSVDNLKQKVAEHAVANNRVNVVRQLILTNHPATLALSEDQRKSYFGPTL